MWWALLEGQKSLIAIKSCDSKVNEVTVLSDFKNESKGSSLLLILNKGV